MCQANGKKINDYTRLETTEAFIDALSLETGIPASKLFQQIKGRGDRVQQGTWVHPLVAVNLAQWLSPQFAVWCSKLIYSKVLENARLSPEQQGAIQKAVQDRVYDLAPQTNLNPSFLFSQIYGELKRYYKVAKYDQIKSRDFEGALAIVRNWNPVSLPASHKPPVVPNVDVLALAANNRVLELERQRGVAMPNFHVLLFADLHRHFEVETLSDIAPQDMPAAIRFIQAYDPSLPALTSNQMPFTQEQLGFLAKIFKRANQDVADPTTRAGQTGRFGLALQWAVEDLTAH
jgi:hypothetical protein